MSLNAATIELLIAKGLSAADILDVARATEVKADRTNAERQARYRARKRNAVTVTGVSPIERDQNPSSPSPATEPDGSSAVESPKPKRKHRLPENWQPEPFKLGSVCGQIVAAWQPGRIERELSKFRDHHRQKGTMGEDWQAGWRMWVQKSDEFEGNGNGRTGHAGQVAGLRGTRPSPALELWKRGALREAEEDSRQGGAPDWGAGAALPTLGAG